MMALGVPRKIDFVALSQAQQPPGVGPEVYPVVATRKRALPKSVALHHHAVGAAELQGGLPGDAEPGQEFFKHSEGEKFGRERLKIVTVKKLIVTIAGAAF